MMNKMRTILAMSVMLVFISITNAQENDLFKFGIKGGVNHTNITNNNSKGKIGPVGGLFTQYKLSESLALRSELLYSAYGAKSKSNSSAGNTIKLNYIQLFPALLRIHPIPSISFELGPYASYLLSTKGVRKSNFHKLDYGGALGANYHITNQIEIGLRYNIGLRDITRPEGKSKNRVFQMALSYSF